MSNDPYFTEAYPSDSEGTSRIHVCPACSTTVDSIAEHCPACGAACFANEPEPVPEVLCWRCQKSNAADTVRCLYCEATLQAELHEKTYRHSAEWNHGLVTMVGHYALALVLLLVQGWFMQFGVHHEGKKDVEVFREALPILVITDVLFLALTFFSYFHLRREASQPPGRKVLQAWLLGPPLLAILLMINIGYHWWLRKLFNLEDMQLPFWGSDLWPWTVLLICIQPAVSEELFFRQVIFGTLRRHLSFHGAIWTSALIFALAHLGSILSIPTLMLAGALFAYTRAATGSLLLPMILHFTHNLIVVML